MAKAAQTALEFYRQAGQRAPSELPYVLAEGEMLVALGRVPEALVLLQAKVSYFENSPAIRDAVGQLLVQTGKYPEAIRMYRQASILSEKDDGIRERLSMAYYYNKQYKGCREVLTRITSTEASQKRGADLLQLQGECQLQIGDARGGPQLYRGDRSQWVLRQALAGSGPGGARYRRFPPGGVLPSPFAGLDNKLSETHLLMGYALVRQKNFDAALKSFKTASSLDNSDTTSLCMVGYTLAKMGREKDAMKILRAGPPHQARRRHGFGADGPDR